MKLNMKFIIVLLAAAGGLVLTGQSLHAHHSAAMFDDDKTVELSGTIKEFQWKNPHVWIQVIVKNANGTTKEWSVEGGGPNSLSRNGWRPGTFKPGDEVTMRVHPMRDGTAAGNFMAAKWSDGRTLGKWD
jgi:hypothetical protein